MAVAVFCMVVGFQLMERILFYIPAFMHYFPQDLIWYLPACRYQPHPADTFFSILLPDVFAVPYHPHSLFDSLYLKTCDIPALYPLPASLKFFLLPLPFFEQLLRILEYQALLIL